MSENRKGSILIRLKERDKHGSGKGRHLHRHAVNSSSQEIQQLYTAQILNAAFARNRTG
jgi:hypothetical protein